MRTFSSPVVRRLALCAVLLTVWFAPARAAALEVWIYQSGSLWTTTISSGAYAPLGGQWWEDATSLTTWPDQNEPLYIIQDEHLWSVSKDDGWYIDLGDGWGGPTLMTMIQSENQHWLYIVQGGNLWKVKPSTGKYQILGEYSTWADNPTSMNGLFIIESSRLWQINLGGWPTQFGTDNWSGPTIMTSYDGYLYIVQASKLWKVALFGAQAGKRTRVGTNTWPSATSMAGGFYPVLSIVNNSRLYQVDLQTGGRSQVGGVWWGGPTLMTGPAYE